MLFEEGCWKEPLNFLTSDQFFMEVVFQQLKENFFNRQTYKNKSPLDYNEDSN